MTKKTYNVEAKGVVKVWMDVEASSQEEAEALAEKHKEQYYTKAITLSDEPNPWQPLYDGYTLEITSVRPAKTYPQCPPRKFIPTYDD